MQLNTGMQSLQTRERGIRTCVTGRLNTFQYFTKEALENRFIFIDAIAKICVLLLSAVYGRVSDFCIRILSETAHKRRETCNSSKLHIKFITPEYLSNFANFFKKNIVLSAHELRRCGLKLYLLL